MKSISNWEISGELFSELEMGLGLS